MQEFRAPGFILILILIIFIFIFIILFIFIFFFIGQNMTTCGNMCALKANYGQICGQHSRRTTYFTLPFAKVSKIRFSKTGNNNIFLWPFYENPFVSTPSGSR